MTQKTALLAIVIPTRNRHQYVISAIESLLRIPSPDLEIVIEDNSDSKQLQHWIQEKAPDIRITYNYSNAATSQAGNYERSMRGVKAEYVAFIGDDDGVNPEILEATGWAKEQGYDAVVPVNKANFVWPDLQISAKGAIAPGELRISPITGRAWQSDPEAELRKCLFDAGQNFHDLPKAYYGIVRREIMEQVRAKTGAFFPGVSPDLAAAVALANVTRKVCVVDYPLFLPGASLKSVAGTNGLRHDIGRLGDQPHLAKDCEAKWTDIVPPFYSGQTIWAEGCVEALLACGREDLLQEFNVPKLYASLIMFYPKFLRITVSTLWSALHRTKRGVGNGALALLICFFQLGCLRGRCLLTRLKRHVPEEKTYSQNGISDIQQAVRGLQEYLRSNGWSFGPQGVSGPSTEKEFNLQAVSPESLVAQV